MASGLKLVDFRGDTLLAAQRDDGVFVAIKPICDRLGLNWSAQFRRVSRDTLLSKGVAMMAMPLVGAGQETVLLRLDLLHGWLFSIDDKRVHEHLRDAVLLYKSECYATLFSHFHGRARPAAEGPSREELAEARISDDAKLRKVTEVRLTFGHRAAARLWLQLGLDFVPEMLHAPQQPDLFDENSLTLGGMQ